MSTENKVHHWHIAHGLAGYGPEGTDGLAYYTDPESLADGIRYELDRDADALIDSADASAEAGEYEDAWKTRKLADEIENLRTNLDNDRRNGPTYEHDRAAWRATILRTVGEKFPLVVSPPAGQLYVWPCDYGYHCEDYYPTPEERIERLIAYLDSIDGPAADVEVQVRRILIERQPE